MKGLSLGDAGSLIQNTCRAIDIRAIAFESGDELTCAVAVIRLTYRSLQKVKIDQTEIGSRLGKIDDERAQVLFDVLPISEFEPFLAKVEEGRVSIAGIELRISSSSKDIYREKLEQYSNLLPGEPDSMYPYYEVMVPSGNEPRSLLEAAGLTGPSLGVSALEDLQSWLGANVFGSAISMVIVVPVYAQIYGSLGLKSGTVEAQFSAHRWLFDRAKKTGILRLHYGGNTFERKDLKPSNVGFSDDIETGTVAAFFSLDPSYRDARVHFQFLDSELGLLCTREEMVSRMLSPAIHPLYTSFSLFDAGKSIETYLLSPQGKRADDYFGAAVSWLLELCGFRVLNLSILRDAEHLRVDGKEEGSCDMLAALESSSLSFLLLVDCTTGVPDRSKLARIRLTAAEVAKLAAKLFARLQVTVRPVIIVSKDVPELRNPEYLPAGTFIIDRSQLRSLLDFVVSGNQEQALMTICSALDITIPGSQLGGSAS